MALPLVAPHTPPVAVSVKVMDVPVQTVVVPPALLMLPASGDGFTVSIYVADAAPQLAVTV